VTVTGPHGLERVQTFRPVTVTWSGCRGMARIILAAARRLRGAKAGAVRGGPFQAS